MPQVFRLGCAGMVLIAIAALTSVGLYAVVAGGVPWAGTGSRTTPGGAQVLVTIQAAPVTPTSGLTAGTQSPSGSQPARPGSTGVAVVTPALAPPPATSAGPPSTASAAPSAAATATSATAALAGTPVPSATVAAPPAGATSGPSTPSAGAASGSTSASQPGRASHEGLALEIVEVERGWQVRGPDGNAVQRRDGSELITVQVRLVNEAPELRFLADTDLVLVADDGARLAPRQTPPLREPHLLTVPVPPRDSVRGWLTYDVPAGLEPTRLQWSPTRPDRPRADATYMIPLPR